MEWKLRQQELRNQADERERQKKKDDKEKKRRESLAGQTRFYGEALKHALPKMGNDPSEFPSYFKNVESTFAMYEVPKNLQAKLIMPVLNERSKTLLALSLIHI